MGLFSRKKKKVKIEQPTSTPTVKSNKPRFEAFSDNVDGIPTLFYDPCALHIEDIDQLKDGYAFEEMTAKILKCNGFKNIEVTKKSGDYGIDVLAEKDGIKYAIQCKKYTNNVGVDAVREALTGKTFFNCHIGAVMTNSHFTAQARTLAQKSGVVLWGREELEEMIKNVRK